MGRTVIVSEETLQSLLQANAALSAWYHEFVRASREQTPVTTPSDATRKAFLDRIASEFPDVGGVAQAIGTPPVYVPPPIAFAPVAVASAPAAAPAAPEAPAAPSGPAMPAMVNPRLVKY